MFLPTNAWAVWSSCMFPPGYSPLFTDPTLTLTNVTAVMKDVQQWEDVAGWMGIHYSKCDELKRQNPTTDQAKQACWDYWLHHHPAPYWRILADGLYCWGQHGALEVLQMNYLKGESTGPYHSLLGNWVHVCNSITCCPCLRLMWGYYYTYVYHILIQFWKTHAFLVKIVNCSIICTRHKNLKKLMLLCYITVHVYPTWLFHSAANIIPPIVTTAIQISKQIERTSKVSCCSFLTVWLEAVDHHWTSVSAAIGFYNSNSYRIVCFTNKILCYLLSKYARANQGSIILRIEDTDKVSLL